ncbi:MAG: hypothetical protein EOO04_31680 [Chitinophagaceae bacterium]|nr:MAG: hypothetical protein EOO04_31680 [Chitinophagaceae bacterium]
MHFITKYKLDHLVFWVCVVLFYGLLREEILRQHGAVLFLTDLIVHTTLLASLCYCNIYVLFPKYFRNDRFLLYAVLVIAALGIYTVLHNAFDTWMSAQSSEPTRRSFFYYSYYNFSVGLFYLAFTLSLILSKRWYGQQLQLQQMQTEKLRAELQYLKAQLNPHFLFNSINTIYFQIDKSNTEARESLEQFSAMLRYQLYECNEEQIPIEQELHYLESYVELQRLRKSHRHAIVFKTDPSVRNFQIAPLLLLPFVENAFKHLSNHTDSLNEVELDLSRRNGSFIFKIKNTVSGARGIATSSGIGLKNVQRRLELLYQDRYDLAIRSDAHQFAVNLEIQLS